MTRNISPRKATILAQSESIAPRRQKFRQRAAFFHREDLRYLKFIIPEGLQVLELGCGTGDVLAGLQPCQGVRVDFSPALPRKAMLIVSAVTIALQAPSASQTIAKAAGPIAGLNFMQVYDGAIFFPMRSLLAEAEKIGLLQPNAVVLASAPDMKMRVIPGIPVR